MNILDRYIVRAFLVNFGILFVVLMSLFVLVDLIIDFDEFLKGGQVRADRYGGVFLATMFSIVDYYGPVIVLMYVFLSGLLVVTAMGFTLSGLQRTQELTAMVASGLSLYRVAGPLLITGIFLNAMTIPCQELIIPRLASKLARSKRQIKYDTIESFPVYYAADGQRLISAAKFDAVLGQLQGVTILERDEQGSTRRRISATQAIWQDHGGGEQDDGGLLRRKGWRLIAGYATTPVDRGFMISDAEPVDFVVSDLSPTVLLARRTTSYPRLLSLSKLQEMQSNQAVDEVQKGHITQIMWSRFSLLVLNVLILLMGLPFFLHRAPGNLRVQAVKATAVCLGAWGCGLVMLQVSSAVVNPITAAWLPVVIYLPISFGLLQMVKT